jgi:hypothetical protein
VKTYILRHKAGAVAIAILATMPLIAAPFDKAGTVVLAELVSLVVAVGGAALRQRFNQNRARPAGEGRHVRWDNVAVAAALIFIALLIGLSVVESITGRPISKANDNTGGWPTSPSEIFDTAALASPRQSPWSSRLSAPCVLSSRSSTIPFKLAAHRSPGS